MRAFLFLFSYTRRKPCVAQDDSRHPESKISGGLGRAFSWHTRSFTVSLMSGELGGGFYSCAVEALGARVARLANERLPANTHDAYGSNATRETH